MTFVERESSCIVGWRVVVERDEGTLQSILDASPQAVWYYSDLLATYKALIYTPGTHTPMLTKAKPIVWRASMQNCAIIWPVSGGKPAASLSVSRP